MPARSGSEELSVKEQQAELWEEKLSQRSVALVESGRALQQRRAQLNQVLEELQRAGVVAPTGARELLKTDPLLPSPHVGQAQAAAQAARKTAVEARERAAQIWEGDLARQNTAVNHVLQSMAQAQAQAQQDLEDSIKPVESEPVLLRSPTPPRAKPPPPRPAEPAARAPPGGPHNRTHSRAKLKVQVDFESDHNFFTGFSSDISEGGLFVATVNIQPLGSPVEVAFALPTGEQVMARGQVKWVREATHDARVQPGMGIQFETLTEDVRDAVHRFIELREPIFYDE